MGMPSQCCRAPNGVVRRDLFASHRATCPTDRLRTAGIVPTGWYAAWPMKSTAAAEPRHASKTRLLDAALNVIRAKGYGATRVEDVCEAAGLTKGSFFHHFKSKDELAIASAEHWSEVTDVLFAQAPYQRHADPLDRLLGYVDFRRSILTGDLAGFTCLLGTMVQEVYDTHPGDSPGLRARHRLACGRCGERHRRCQAAVCAARPLDARWPFVARPGGTPGCFRSGQGDAGNGRGRRVGGPPAALSGAAVSAGQGRSTR